MRHLICNQDNLLLYLEVYANMKVYSYVISRDFGFAPNPFYGICTLATCKPLIRKHCCVGDYVIGISPLDKGRGNKLVMLMRVTEVTTFDEYWSNPRFECKKPVMNGSLMKLYGDNIYHHDEQGNWIQEDSHHTNADGTPNPKNLKRDTGTTDRVLISADYYYLGKNCIALPPALLEEIKVRRNHRRVNEAIIPDLIDFVESNCPEKGYLGEPHKFNTFKRYNGK